MTDQDKEDLETGRRVREDVARLEQSFDKVHLLQVCFKALLNSALEMGDATLEIAMKDMDKAGVPIGSWLLKLE